MAWTAPRTWIAGEVVTAALMNTHLRDNLLYLFARPHDEEFINEASDYSTTSTSFTNIDGSSPGLALSVTTTGGDLLVYFYGAFSCAHTDLISRAFLGLDFTVDGTRQGGDDGLLTCYIGRLMSGGGDAGGLPVCFVKRVTGLAAGAHTIIMQWKGMSSGAGTTTVTLFAGAGTTRSDSHPEFGANEA